MRVLLDENVDRRLATAFDAEHNITTVRARGWSGKTNGDLLTSAAAEFDAMVTLDTNMQHQQNLPAYDLAVILITARTNRRQDLLPAMPDVNRILPTVEPGQLYVVAASGARG